ncbi:MAG TPA: hypothetical protein VM433_07345 [Mycobacteriales bacterium]|nr:hypothetical protein [Mycobacteriales bacterium]
MTDRLRTASPYLLAALLVGAGTTHFLAPGPYDAIVPSFLPAPRAWTYGSGVVELLVGAAVAAPRTRRAGATAAAVLLVAVFPANVQMALDPGDVPRWLAVARLPLQVPLVLWALQVRRASARRAGSSV